VSELSVDLEALSRGDKQAWDRFVKRYARVVFAAVQNRLGRSARPDEVDDAVPEVFLRLCKADFRLLRGYDPARPALTTWLTVVASSTVIDHMRRRKPADLDLDAVPEDRLAVEPRLPARIRIPAGLLSPRQALVLELLYRPRPGGRRRGRDDGRGPADGAQHAPQGLGRITHPFPPR